MTRAVGPATWARAREAFRTAVELPPDERSGFLDEACGGDLALRSLLDRLLASDRRQHAVLDAGPGGVTLPANDEDTLAGQTLGRFRLLRVLGSGGMAVVYLARQTEPFVREVAVKVLRRGMESDDLLARFEAERRSLALMDHPGIARILDAGSTNDGRPYFVLEYVRGLPITDFCDERNSRLAERLDLFMAVCQAVRHAHDRGVIHRDIKPSNVLVRDVDGKGVPVVIDFGIAKAAAEQVSRPFATVAGAAIGTPGYMSPEQADTRHGAHDVRTDVYALGVLLFELLTDGLPNRFGLAPSARLPTSARNDWPIAKAEVEGALDAIVQRAIRAVPTDRYPSVDALIGDLDRVREGRPLSRRPLLRRAPKRWGASVALLAAMVALGWGVAVRTAPRAPGEPAMAAPSTAAPSIAVLPLTDLSAGESPDPLTVSIATDLITRLSKLRDLFVVGPSSMMLFPRAADPRQVGRDLGVRYVLQGSLQRDGDRLRVYSQLIDAQSRTQLWAEEYDRQLVDLFAVQDEIAAQIATELNIQLLEGDQARLWRRSTTSIEAYEVFAQALDMSYRMSPESHREAVRLYEQAIALDPGFAQAHAMLGAVLSLEVRWGWSRTPEATKRRMIESAERAVALDGELPTAHIGQAIVHLSAGDVNASVASGERAVALAPGSSLAHAALASALIYADRPRRALAEIERAIRLSPYHPMWYNATLGHAHRQLGNHRLALDAYRRVLVKRPDFLFVRLRRVATLVDAGRLDEARREASELQAANPELTLESVAGAWGQRAMPFLSPASLERLTEQLALAGIE